MSRPVLSPIAHVRPAHLLLTLGLLVSLAAGVRSAIPSDPIAVDPSVVNLPIIPIKTPPPALLVKLEGDKPSEPLPLSKLDVGVTISGYLSRTTLTMTFCNPHPRALEGELYFPLPEGSTISGYALDIKGQMVDGVAVPKDEARITFEKEERHGVDPGLLEWVKGNNFRTRVYPIPANGCRTVRVEYVSDLTTIDAAPGSSHTSAQYLLPLHFQKPIDTLHFHLEAVGGDTAPQVSDGNLIGAPTTNGGATTAGTTDGTNGNTGTTGSHSLEFEKLNDRYQADITMQAAQPTDDLVITLPDISRQQSTVETDPSGKTTFVLNDLPTTSGTSTADQSPVKRIGIAWDASMSRKTEDTAREIKLLTTLLQRIKEVDIDILLFRNKMDNLPVDKAQFSIQDGDASAVTSYLKNISYDGGTDLGRLHLYRSPGSFHPDTPTEAKGELAADYSYWLLFSDGLGNLGDAMPGVMEKPVYTLSSASGADYSLLRAIAQKSGGSYFNLQKLSDEEVIGSIGKPVYSFVSATYDKGSISELYPGGPQEVHGRLTVTGKLLVPETTITLNYGWGDKVTGHSTYTLKQEGTGTTTGLTSHYWAEKKAEELELLPDKNKDALLALAKQFNLVTPATSLLVLETLQQYVTYHIEPPKTLPDMAAAYQKAIAAAGAEEHKTKEAKVQQVTQMWNEQVKWWNTKFTYPANFKYVEQKEKAAAANPARNSGVMDSAGSTTGGGAGSNGRVLHGHSGPHGSRAPESGSGDRDEVELQQSTTTTNAPRPLAPPPATPALASVAGGGFGGAAGRAVPQDARHLFNASRNALGLPAGADGTAAGEDNSAADITIKPWDPQTPYLNAIKGAGSTGAYAAYLKQQQKFGASPAFYLDVADYLFKNNEHELAVRVLTNIAEMELESPQLLRVLAHKLDQEGEMDLAIDVFEKVLALRPEEPQSHRDLALALADRGTYRLGFDKTLALADLHRAEGLLNDVVMGTWDNRFPGIETIALSELNHLNGKVKGIEGGKAQAYPSDPGLAKLLDVDVRIALTWDTDMTDMDLWVTEPSGEKCYYAHNRTTVGGAISNDFTQGYGPEVYMIHHAMPGVYKIQANYYGSHQQTLSGPSTLQVTLITNYGRANEKRQSLTVRLVENKEVIDVGAVAVK